MRIAFVSTIRDHAWGGADTLWTHAAEAALARGDGVLIAMSPVIAEHERVQALIARGAKLILRPVPLPRPRSLVASVARRASSALKRGEDLVGEFSAFQPDVVIITGGGTYDLLLEPALSQWFRSGMQPFRLILNWQAENPQLPAPEIEKMQTLLPLAERLFFVSQRNLDTTRRHLLLPLERARVVHNPLRCGAGSALPWPASPLRFATVSRLHPTKGIALLLHALHAALSSIDGWHLDIIGNGPEESYLRATVAKLRLQSRVTFAGRIDTLQEIWSSRHLLLSPAIEDGVPMTIPEAMLHGRPVLATCVGGAEDWIIDGTNGYLCAAPTLPLLTEAITRVWSDRTTWPKLGAQAACYAAAAYRPDDVLQLIAPVSSHDSR